MFNFDKLNAETSIAIGGGAVYMLSGNTLAGSQAYLAEFASPVDALTDSRMAYIGDVRFMCKFLVFVWNYKNCV